MNLLKLSFRIFAEPSVEDQEQQHRITTFLFVVQSLFLFAVAGVFVLFFPSVIPYGLFDAWQVSGGVLDWLWAGRWWFAWGAGVTALFSFTSKNSHYENEMAERLIRLNAKVSLRAGFFEEIIFRWLLLVISFPTLFALNYILGGFAGVGLPEMFYVHILSPIANWTSFGMLEPYFLNQNWLVGAAIISANAKFRDGHKYQGLFGLINSWFGGLFFFKLMFAYGMWAAILVHFLYDLSIFIVRYMDQVSERMRGR